MDSHADEDDQTQEEQGDFITEGDAVLVAELHGADGTEPIDDGEHTYSVSTPISNTHFVHEQAMKMV
jgi:hypothetical protein